MPVRLRRYERADLQPFATMFADAETVRYMDAGTPHAPEASAAMLERILAIYESDPAFWIWAIEEDGRYAGHAELKRRRGRSEYEIIYALERCRWGRGLGGRVVDLLLDEARARSMPFVIATVAADNAASIAILLRRDFRAESALSAELETAAYRLDLGGES